MIIGLISIQLFLNLPIETEFGNMYFAKQGGGVLYPPLNLFATLGSIFNFHKTKDDTRCSGHLSR